MNYKTDDIYSLIGDLIKDRNRLIIAVDGRCASGKTTLATGIEKEFGSETIHTDDFFLPFNLRTEKRLSSPGGNIHYERMYDEVVSHLSEERIIYGAFDCSSGTIHHRTIVEIGGVLVIEGAYSMHPYFGKYYDLSIFVTSDLSERLLRIEARNGKDKLKVFENKWIPLEENYISAFEIEKAADYILNT